jgi:malate synthase
MHGPDEGGFTERAVRRGREICSVLPPNTIKVGIMDEERRTSANLKAAIHAACEARRVHQHRLPRSHRRRDPHLDAAGPVVPQGRDEGAELDQGL